MRLSDLRFLRLQPQILDCMRIMSRLTPRVLIPSFAFVLFALCYQLWHLSTKRVEGVSDDRQVDTYDFVPTEIERLCQSGASLDGLSTKTAIPNTVHYIIGLHDAELSFAAYLSVLTALRSLDPTTVKLHHTESLNIGNKYIQSLLQDKRVQLVFHTASGIASKMKQSNHFAHLADVLRLNVLYEEG